MHKFKLFPVYFSLSFFIVVIAGYLTLIYGLPALVNSQKLTPKLENIIKEKTGLNLDIEGLALSVSPKLSAKITATEITLPVEGKSAAVIKNVDAGFDVKTLSARKINIDNLSADVNLIQKAVHGMKKGQAQKGFDFSKLPEFRIKQAEIYYTAQNTHKLDIYNLEMKDDKDQSKIITFNAFYRVPKISKNIEIGRKGKLYIKNNALFAKGFQLKIDNSELFADGKIYAKDNSRDLAVKARNIPAKTTLDTILFCQKLHDKSKKFIENFKDFGGGIDLDLSVKGNDMSGKLIARKLSGKSVLFNVPIYFPIAEFSLKNNILTSVAEGTLGGEKVVHSLYIKDMTSKNRLTIGKVKSTLTEKMITKYLPSSYRLQNTADAKVVYKIQNSIPEVKYYLQLNEGSDVFYKDAYLGLRDKRRLLYAMTVKVPNGLRLKEYDYSIISPSSKEQIILGDGMFIKKNGKLTPQYITCRTNGYAPVSVTGSFGKYVNGGEFSGNLKYNFITDKITGNFEIIHTIFNDFYVRSAKVLAELGGVNISAQGRYKHQPFDSKMRVANRLDGIFIVHNMEIFMDKFVIIPKATHSKTLHIHKHPVDIMDKIDDVSSKINKIDMTIEEWNIAVKELLFDDMILNDIRLFGNLRDSLFKFTMPDIMFAKGKLSAQGQYNFKNNSSIIDFSAREIDSNIAAEELFNLTNQIQGTARAKLHVHTYNNLQDICAFVNFEMDDGFLPQLGSTEFMLGKTNKKRKVNMYNLTNIDFSSAESLNSDIKGSFELHNYDLENIVITSKQKFMGLYINGKYNIHSQEADLKVFGKYDKDAPKGIKILFVPLNWVLKLVLRPENSIDIYKEQLAKIPPIEAKKCRFQYFRVSVKGNLNDTDNMKIILKRIK